MVEICSRERTVENCEGFVDKIFSHSFGGIIMILKILRYWPNIVIFDVSATAPLVCNLYHIKISILNCLDNTKNANENIFIITQYLPLFP